MRIPFDLIGDKNKSVAIVEIMSENRKKIAQEIMQRYPRVKSVLEKIGGRAGKYRNYKYKLLAGSRATEVLHKEYGYQLKLDPRKVYFSPREGDERARISGKVRRGENVLIMFSGAGPFAVAIGKKQPNSKIVCVEHNPAGAKYCEENATLNKLGNIESICADVRKFRTQKKFDRIIMPHPTEAYKFLKCALKFSKKGTVIHLYGLSEKKDFSDIVEKIINEAEKSGAKIKIIEKRSVLKFGVRINKVRVDLKVV